MSTRIIDPNDINKKKSQDETAPASQPLSTTQGGAGGGTATPTTGQQPPQAPSSGSFTDLGKYKQAAQNAGSRIAEGVESKFATKTRLADTALKDTSKEFTTAMDRSSGYAATAEGRAGAVSNVGSYTAGQSGYQQPSVSPINPLNPNMPQRGVAPSQRVQTTPSPEFTEADFKDVINKEYTGIRRADQTTSYGDALERAKTIRNYAKLLNDPNRKSTSDLMEATFGRDQQYNKAMTALDAYLYTQSGVANQLKNNEKVRYAQDYNKRLDQAKTDLAAQAMDRAQQISEMREAARGAFSNVATGRTQQVEDRLNNVRKDWNKLTNTVRDSFYTVDPKTGQRVIKSGQIGIDPVTQILTGMGPGSQLFNQIKDEESLNQFIKTREFERDRLISNQEQQNLARLEALSRLAKTPGMEYTNKYYDASRAGTLSARDSIDRENVRNLLGQSMQEFQDLAGTNLQASGYGQSSFKDWVWKDNRPQYVNRQVGRTGTATGNLDKYLAESGYTYEQPEYNLYNPVEMQEALKNVQEQQGAGNNITAESINSKLKDLLNFEDMFKDIGQKAAYDSAALLSFGLFDGKGAAEKRAQEAADADAYNKLLGQLQNQLNTSGFKNYATGADMTKEENKQKMQALIDLYNSLDSTNIGNY